MLPLPNIVAWSEKMLDKMERPRLAIPPVPLTPAAEITRIAPQLENSIVAPPPDAAHLTHRRNSLTLQTSVVAPPPEVNGSNAAFFQAPQPAVVAPPPSVEIASTRPLGDLNIGRSSVIAPAPQLSLAEQRAVAGSRSSGIGGGAPQYRSSASVGFWLRTYRRVFWRARPHHCAESASGRRCAARSAGRKPSRNFRSYARGPRRCIWLARCWRHWR